VRELLDTNIKGVYSGMRYAVGHMRKGGVIINTASFVGTAKPVPLAVAYGGTKAAVVSMTRAAALELAGKGIDVVAIPPGSSTRHWSTGSPVARDRKREQPSLRPSPRAGSSPHRTR
jgi:NAD(P)-dependent dehydrogenase (short-subunit alcohol dehydrogenase family)